MEFDILGPRKGRLKRDYNYFATPIMGYRESISSPLTDRCSIYENGHLRVHTGFEWDFATGAIDTPDMVKASLAHDALCGLINHGKLPASEQKAADKFFRKVLKECGTSWFRRWYAYLAVRAYQMVFNNGTIK